MLEVLLGSKSCEQVLFFLYAREEGYPRDIARFYSVDYRPIRNQLEKLENGGVLISRLVGRTRLYSFNPRYPFLTELKILLEKSFGFLPTKDQDQLKMIRKRPRRAGKPL